MLGGETLKIWEQMYPNRDQKRSPFMDPQAELHYHIYAAEDQLTDMYPKHMKYLQCCKTATFRRLLEQETKIAMTASRHILQRFL